MRLQIQIYNMTMTLIFLADNIAIMRECVFSPENDIFPGLEVLNKASHDNMRCLEEGKYCVLVDFEGPEITYH